jgi:hypothetical protein
VGAWLLGVWRLRLLLGTRRVGAGALHWCALDTRLLGLGRWRLHMARRVLGPVGGILWRNQLRVRLYGLRLLWRVLESWCVLLQRRRHSRQSRDCSQRIQPRCDQQRRHESRQLQRRTWRHDGSALRCATRGNSWPARSSNGRAKPTQELREHQSRAVGDSGPWPAGCDGHNQAWDIGESRKQEYSGAIIGPAAHNASTRAGAPCCSDAIAPQLT